MERKQKTWTRRERFAYDAHTCPFCDGVDLVASGGSRLVGGQRESYVECKSLVGDPPKVCGQKFIMVLKKTNELSERRKVAAVRNPTGRND